jgi:nicotinamide mononucleotide transporter
MNEFFDLVFSQFEGYTTFVLVLELVAITLGLFSVIFSARNNIWLYPTGLVSTGIFIYLMYTATLYGDLIVNIFYFYMSAYGWLLWSNLKSSESLTITRATLKDNQKCALIFSVSVIFVTAVYLWFGMFGAWWTYVDILTTGLFFVGMWLLAKRKIENWIYLIIGDIIVVPLFYYKGLVFTAIFYIVLTIIAIFGYRAWEKTLQSNKPAQSI